MTPIPNKWLTKSFNRYFAVNEILRANNPTQQIDVIL